MDLLERNTEFALVNCLLEDLAQGLGSVVVVSGPAGSGRTALLSAFADAACTSGIPVAAAGFSRFEQGLALELPGRVDGEPMLVCVDDVHNADEESVVRLMKLALAWRSLPIVLVLGLRPTQRHTYREALAYLQDRTRSHWIELDRLSVGGVRRIAETEFGIGLDEATGTEMMALSGGNLMLLKAIVADYRSVARDAAVPPERLVQVLGPAYRRAVLDCHYRFEAEVRAVAQTVAIMREFATPRAVAEVAAASAAVVDQAVLGLTSAGLLENGRFRQQAAESAVLTDMSIQHSALLHRRAAAALRAMGAPAVEVARRLIVADYVDESWTGYLLEEAVTQALAVDDRALATDALRLALRGARDDEQRADILVRIALGYAATDPELCCQYFHEAIALVPEKHLWPICSRVLGEQMARRGRGQEALTRLAAAAADTAVPAELVRLAADRLLVCGDYPALLGTTEQEFPLRVPDGAGDQLARYESVRFLVTTLTAPHRDADAVRSATDALYGCTFVEHTASGSLAALTGLLYSGELELVHSLANEFVEGARRRRAPVWQARFLAVRVEASVREGRYEEAMADAEQALSLLPPQAWGIWIGGPASSLFLASAMTDERRLARKYLTGTVPPSMFETRYGLHYLYGRGHLHLADGRVRAALADFSGCGRMMAGWNIDHEHVLPWRLAAAGALLVLGDQDGAVDLIEERIRQTADYRRPATPAGQGSMLAEQRRSPRERVFHVLATSAQQHGLLDGIRRITGAREETASVATARYKIEDRYSSYLNKLTFSEQQVALLAAKGRSNRNIARSLSVTISTVEQHLTRTYRKLEVTGRQELRAKLG